MGNWSATGYLLNATGPFDGFYQWMASSDGLMNIIDPVNIAALILIGLGFFWVLLFGYLLFQEWYC